MCNHIENRVFRTLLVAVALASVVTLSAQAILSSPGRSYNVQRKGMADLGPPQNGYICGYGNFVYVSKGSTYAIVDITTPTDPQKLAQHLPHEDEHRTLLGHGKAYVWPYGDQHIHLILPNNSGTASDASIYIIDVSDPYDPVLKGWVRDLPDPWLVGGRFYSAFPAVDIVRSGEDNVWLLAASNTCWESLDNCNDTIYIFNIRDVFDATPEEIPVLFSEPDFKWYPGCNPGFGPGPDSARGHDVTAHGAMMVVTNPGGGLYLANLGPLINQDPPGLPEELGRCEYDNAMTHDGWMSDDMAYVYTMDEHFLEWGCQRPIGDVTVYNIQGGVQLDVCSQRRASYAPSTAVTSHYYYVKGDVGYVANYNRGLRVIDLTDPEDPVEVGFYDTYLGDDIPSYIFGYPYVHGTVDLWPYYLDYVSACDHDSGVFVLQFTGATPGCIPGYVRSAEDQLPIAGAWVYSHEADRGAVSDEDGHYELKTASDYHSVTASALGFHPLTHQNVNTVNRDCQTINQVYFDLESNASELATAWNNGKKVVVDEASRIHAVYQNLPLSHSHDPGGPSTNSHSVTYAFSTDRGISWEFKEFQAAYHPSIAIDGHNLPHIAMLQHLGATQPPPNEYVVHYWIDLSGQWQYEVIEGYPDKFGVYFTPVIDVYQPTTNPEIHIAWEHSEDLTSRILYWNSSSGVTEVILNQTGTEPHPLQFPTIALDGSGTPHVLWQNNEFGGIYHSYRNSTWEPGTEVAAGGTHPCVDRCEGIIYAVWEEGSPSDVFIGKYTGTGWEKCPVCETIYQSQFPVLGDSNVVWFEPTPLIDNYVVLYSKWTGGGLTGEITCGTTPETLSQGISSTYPQGFYHSLSDICQGCPCDRFYVIWTEDLMSHQRLDFALQVPAE